MWKCQTMKEVNIQEEYMLIDNRRLIIMKKIISIIPLLILLGVAFLLSDDFGTDKKDEEDTLSPTIEPQPKKRA